MSEEDFETGPQGGEYLMRLGSAPSRVFSQIYLPQRPGQFTLTVNVNARVIAAGDDGIVGVSCGVVDEPPTNSTSAIKETALNSRFIAAVDTTGTFVIAEAASGDAVMLLESSKDSRASLTDEYSELELVCAFGNTSRVSLKLDGEEVISARAPRREGSGDLIEVGFLVQEFTAPMTAAFDNLTVTRR